MPDDDDYQVTENEVLLAAMMMSASGALQITLVEIGERLHGGHDGEWLSELEARFIRATKGIGSENLSEELDVRAVEAAIGNIERIVSWVRDDLKPPV